MHGDINQLQETRTRKDLQGVLEVREYPFAVLEVFVVPHTQSNLGRCVQTAIRNPKSARLDPVLLSCLTAPQFEPGTELLRTSGSGGGQLLHGD
jgi:hypothetical protein